MRLMPLIALAAFVFADFPAHALEATAGGQSVQASQVGINAKVDASNALLKSAIDALTEKIKTCSGRQSLYNPGGTGADGDGCVPIAAGGADQDIEIYTENKTVAYGGTCASASPSNTNCSVTINLPALLPSNAQAVTINWGVNGSPPGYAYKQSLTLATPSTSLAKVTKTYWTDSDSGERAYWQSVNGVVTLNGQRWKTGNQASIGAITISYSLTKGRFVPKQ